MEQYVIGIDRGMMEQMQVTCSKMGLTTDEAFRLFAVKVIRENRIPFEINADPFYDEENIAELERRAQEIQSGAITLCAHDIVEV